MQVRFFGGTRALYDSLATPRNPLGLYFCIDTRELFWGDELLTDGTRIVATEADLPELDLVADGITYFVEETRNGYVISSDRTKWVKVIQAPDGGGSIKAISFAGIELEEVDGIFTIDRRCARKALGFTMPKGMEDEEIVVATESFVTEAISAIDLPEVPTKVSDLENDKGFITEVPAEYITENELEAKGYLTEHQSLAGLATTQDVINIATTTAADIASINTKIEILENNADKYLTAIPSEYITDEELSAKGYLTEHQDLTGYATESWVSEQGFIKEHQSLEGYVKTEDIVEFITISDVEAKNYATEQYVIDAIANQVPVDELAKKDEVVEVKTKLESEILPTINETILPVVQIAATQEWVKEQGYLTEHQSLIGYATEEFVATKIAEAELADKEVDLTSYVTKSELSAIEAKIPTDYLTEVPSEFITETELSVALANIKHPTVDLDGYATTETVNAVVEDLTKTQGTLDRAVAVVENLQKVTAGLDAVTAKQKYEVLPVEGLIVNYYDNEVRINPQHVIPKAQQVGATGNSNRYYVTFRAYAPAEATQVVEGLNDSFDSYFSQLAVDSYGRKYATIWTSIAEYDGSSWSIFGANSTRDYYERSFHYGFKWYNGDKLIATDRVRVVMTNDSCHNDLVPYDVVKRIDEKVAIVTTPDISKFITIEDVEAKGYITEVPSEYITEDELVAKGFITEHQDLSNYYTKSESAEVLAAALAKKASEKPFLVNKFVTKPMGDFLAGDNINGMTIAEIFAKLLGLSDASVVDPDEPADPEVPTTIPDKIIANNSAMYQVNESGEIVEIPYAYEDFTISEAMAAPEHDCFYQIKDTEGNILESGYQHVSEENDSMYYLVLLPNGLDFSTNVTIQYWDNGNNIWKPAVVEMSNDLTLIEAALSDGELELPVYDSEKYTLWIDASLETCAGTDYRFIINE